MARKIPELSQDVEEFVKMGAERVVENRRVLRERVGQRPYRGRKLSHEEEMTNYREGMRSNPESVKEFIKSERDRLGLPELTVDGRVLIPKSALDELKRLERLHRGKEESNGNLVR